MLATNLDGELIDIHTRARARFHMRSNKVAYIYIYIHVIIDRLAQAESPWV